MLKLSMKTVAVATVVGGVLAGAVSASAALNLPTQSCAFVFNTNMKLGSRGQDVKNLQVVLNAYPQTRVAASGIGSTGNESTYFGAATRAAVNKFQALHLAELGISAPTGNAFSGTRGLLNQVCSTTGGTTTGGTTTGGTTTGGTTTSGSVSASIASSQPAGMVVATQAGAALANVTFTGNGTVTNVELQRTGVSSDSTLTNVYLYDGNKRITDAASVVTGGYIRFNASTGLFAVNGSRTITVRADIASGTTGQAVGVKLNSFTAMGGTATTVSNVVGPVLQIGGVTLAAVNLAAMDTSARTVDAGTSNYKVWSDSITVSTRDVNLKAATFKFVGSAPVDSLANLSLYVDGVKVAGPATVDASNNNKVTFDLGSSAYLMKTGTHTVDVMGDVVKGSNRTMTFSIENAADLMIEDSNLAGIAIAPTVASSALTNSNSAFGQITVNRGSVTVNVDPTYSANKVTGGATNVEVGRFTLKAYGEDVKVNSLLVGFATTTITSLNNVSLYVNGGQVGSNTNWTGATSTFTLGSSMIIPANTTVTLTIKADIVTTAGAAHTAGTVAAIIGGASSNAQGQSSSEMISVAAGTVRSNTLTISSGAGTFARTSGFTAVTVAPNTTNVKIGSFTLQANSSEDLKINSAGVRVIPTTYGITNISNVTLKSGSSVIGTPVGNPTTATSTFSFSEIVVPANGTKVFEVYADLGGSTSGSVQADMDITYRGSVSNTTSVSAGAGVAISSSASTLAASTLVQSSPVAQYVIGGSTFGIATFKLKTAAAGTVATVRELRFSTTGTDAIESITVAGVTAPVVSGTSTVTGLNIAVSSIGADVPVTVKFSGFQNSTTGGSLAASIATVNVSLSYVEATAGTGSVITNGTIVASNDMKLVASKPIITGMNSTANLSAGVVKIGEFTVSADANGAIALATTSVIISTSTGGTLNVTGVKLSDNNGASAIANSNTEAAPQSGVAFDLGFTTPYQISAGQSKTFQIWATVAGSFGAAGTSQLSTALDSTLANFEWVDSVSSSTQILTGTGIQNFPVTSYSLKN